MTLACKTADLLALTTHALNKVTSPGQHALLSPDQLKSALGQLTLTVQAAARLAEVAHAEMLTAQCGKVTVGSNTEAPMESFIAERGVAVGDPRTVGNDIGWSERIKAETDKVSKEVEKSVAGTGRLHAEAGKVGRETERAVAETERMKVEAEAERAKAEAEKAGKEAARAAAETERLKVEAMMPRSVKMKIDAETERAKAERERMDVELERSARMGDMPEPGSDPERQMDLMSAAGAVGKEVEIPVQVREAGEARSGESLAILEAEITRMKGRLAHCSITALRRRLVKEIRDLEIRADAERMRSQ